MAIKGHTTTRMAILAAVLVCAYWAAPSAQGQQGLIAEMLSSLTRLGEAVSTLQASVDNVQRTLDAAAEEKDKVLYTPALTVASGLAWCSVVNVSDDWIEVRAELFANDAKLSGGPTLLPPGRRIAYGADSTQLLGRVVRCEFEAIEGSTAGFRAVLHIDGPDANPIVVVAAD